MKTQNYWDKSLEISEASFRLGEKAWAAHLEVREANNEHGRALVRALARDAGRIAFSSRCLIDALEKQQDDEDAKDGKQSARTTPVGGLGNDAPKPGEILLGHEDHRSNAGREML